MPMMMTLGADGSLPEPEVVADGHGYLPVGWDADVVDMFAMPDDGSSMVTEDGHQIYYMMGGDAQTDVVVQTPVHTVLPAASGPGLPTWVLPAAVIGGLFLLMKS